MAKKIEITYEDYENAVPPRDDAPFTEGQLRHMWLHRTTNGIADTGLLIKVCGRLKLVRKRIPAWYEWQNKNIAA